MCHHCIVDNKYMELATELRSEVVLRVHQHAMAKEEISKETVEISARASTLERLATSPHKYCTKIGTSSQDVDFDIVQVFKNLPTVTDMKIQPMRSRSESLL